MDELGIQMVFALSPQAKGRVERTAGTFQDGLVTELRLAGAVTIEEANALLKEFLDRFNARFGVPAQHPEAAYRPLGPGVCLDTALCFRHSRQGGQGQHGEVPLENASFAAGEGCGGGWKAWTAIWLCVTGERSSPARRRHPAQAYSEASTALLHTGHPHVPISTV